MKCLILAAGRGSRLSNKGQPKPLVSFLGLTLIERAIFSASACGIDDFVVVTGYQGKRVRDFLDELKIKRKFALSHIVNEQWDLENGVSVLKARKVINEPFLLMMCDHVISVNAIKKLIAQGVKDDQILLAIDNNINAHPEPVLEEATRVWVQEGKILDIGKNIWKYNALDCGLFLCTPIIFDAVQESIEQGDSTLSGAIKVLADKGLAFAVDVQGEYWFDIDDEASYVRAEKGLLSTLKKSTDGPVSRHLNRPISIRITKALVNRQISPNAISVCCFFISLLAATCMGFNSYLFIVLGAFLAQFSSILDGCDGEIARLKFQTSEFGAWMDAVLDRYSDAVLLTGLIFHSLYTVDKFLGCAAGSFAIMGSLINSYTADKYDKYLLKKLEGRAGPFRLGRDVRIFIIFVGAIFNQAFLTVVFMGLLMNVENLRRIFILRTAEKNG